MKYGDIITLGNHRVMCGDCTNSEDVSRLMQESHAKFLFTSPPYSDIYEYFGNDLAPSHLARFFFVFGKSPVKLNRTILKHGRDFLAGHILLPEKRGVRETDGTLKFTTSNHQYHEKCKQLETVITQGAVKSRPVWGTAQMPVELAEEYIKAVTNEGDCVIDPFGGSGTTLIACERLNRKCFTMEINPAMCDVIVQRFISLTPIFNAERVNELCPA